MKDVFKKIRVTCFICKTPLDGDNLLKRGEHYYCQADYEKTSASELRENEYNKIRKKNYDKIFGS